MTATIRQPFFVLALAFVLTAWACNCDSSTGSNGDTKGGDASDGDANGDGDGDDDDGGKKPPGTDGPLTTEIHVVITIDNGYGFGYGSADRINHYFEGQADHGAAGIFYCSTPCESDADCLAACEGPPGTANCPEDLACDEFGTCNHDRRGPETYIVPADAARTNDYLYVIAWSDEAGTQGFIGQFKDDRGWNRIYTGHGAWEVCATGDNYDPPPQGAHLDDTGPPLEDAVLDGVARIGINEWIRRCNLGPDAPEGEKTYSEGWVSIDEVNSRGHRLHALSHEAEAGIANFPNLCGRQSEDGDRGDAIDPEARWLWYYDAEKITNPDSIFTSSEYLGDFYIFRLPTRVVIAPPG